MLDWVQILDRAALTKKAYRQKKVEDAPAFTDFPIPRFALFVACREPLFPKVLIGIELHFSSIA